MAQNASLPQSIQTLEQLEELLSRPSEQVVDVMRRLSGDLVIIGGGGKIGPSLAGMACRARDAAGVKRRIIVVDLFQNAATRQRIESLGAQTVACDLLDPAAVEALPAATDVIYMAGMKFGTVDKPEITWAVNGLIPDYVSRRYKNSRIVAFSTGCVYPLTLVDGTGSREGDALTPPGEYANSCVARERILQYNAGRYGTKMVLLRLNYAVELRYGVLVDIANQVAAGEVDVTMGHVNIIWQGDVNSSTLRLLEHAACPPQAVNLTSPRVYLVRDLARQLGELMGKTFRLAGREAPTALLSDCSKAVGMLGQPAVPVETVLAWVAQWIARGGSQLNKPTHYQTRDGAY